MKLHKDKYAFLTMMNLIHEISGIREDIVEKDYYVSLLLKELAEKQNNLPAYFKGGTALYKAQKSIRRFSEDIDLTICIDDCSNSQAKKRLELATKKYQSLPRTVRKELEEDKKGSITIVYEYSPLVTLDSEDPLQRFGYVKVEGCSFTVSEPFSTLVIEPILYTYANEEQQVVLQEQFETGPFEIKTIRVERIFVDKIFAAEFYYEREMYFDVAKHMYDVSVMLNMPEIQQLLKNRTFLLQMIGYKRIEETQRIGSDLSDKKYKDFKIFTGMNENKKLQNDYLNMQKNYIFLPKDILAYEFVVERWNVLGRRLIQLDE